MSTLAREMLLFTERWAGDVADQSKDTVLKHHFYETVFHLVAEWCQQPLPLVLPHIDTGLLSEVTAYLIANMGQPLTLEMVPAPTTYPDGH